MSEHVDVQELVAKRFKQAVIVAVSSQVNEIIVYEDVNGRRGNELGSFPLDEYVAQVNSGGKNLSREGS